ncbi:hypothetical protein LINPERPRIM_LOCUS37479, partial [Linum perenne]
MISIPIIILYVFIKQSILFPFDFRSLMVYSSSWKSKNHTLKKYNILK